MVLGPIGGPIPRNSSLMDARAMLGVAWLRLMTAREAYSMTDIGSTSRDAVGAVTCAAEALAMHLPDESPSAVIDDMDAAEALCVKYVEGPIAELFARVRAIWDSRPIDSALTNAQRDAIDRGLQATSDLLALIETAVVKRD